MTDAGNAESPLKVGERFRHVLLFTVILSSSFTVTSLVFSLMNSYMGLAQLALVSFNTSSFITLIISLTLHVVFQNKTSLRVLLMSCASFIIAYYLYLGSKVLSNSLTVIPYPLLIELRNGSHSTYVLDLPQAILITLLVYRLFQRRRRPIPASERALAVEKPSAPRTSS